MDCGGDLWRYCLTSALYLVFDAVDLKLGRENTAPLVQALFLLTRLYKIEWGAAATLSPSPANV
jgi:hypothetical protein